MNRSGQNWVNLANPQCALITSTPPRASNVISAARLQPRTAVSKTFPCEVASGCLCWMATKMSLFHSFHGDSRMAQRAHSGCKKLSIRRCMLIAYSCSMLHFTWMRPTKPRFASVPIESRPQVRVALYIYIYIYM